MQSPHTKNGFTMVELLVVISIISLLTSVILASLSNARDKGKIAQVIVFDTHVYHAIGDQALGFWPLTDGAGTTAVDRSGNNNTGTLSGSTLPAWSANMAPSGAGYALYLNGTDNRVVIPASQTLDSITKNFTISGWLYDTNSANTNQAFFAIRNDNDSPSSGYFLQFYASASYGAPANCAYAPYIGAVGGVDLCGTAPLTKNKWHQLTATYDGTTIKLYVDGVLNNSAAATLSSSFSLSGLAGKIGHEGYSAWFKGYVSNVRVYKAAVTGEAIHKLYAEEASYYENLALRQL